MMLNSDAPLGLIAGLGQLPVHVANAVQARGQDIHVIRLKGFVEPELEGFPGEIIGVAEVGKILKSLKRAGCKDVCFCGIVKRPDFAALKPDMKGMALLPKVVSAARKGDDALLRLLVDTFESEGFSVIGPDVAGGSLLAPVGTLVGLEPTGQILADLKKAAYIASETGRLDIGQGAIVCDGLVLCVEGQEGTDQMLARCAMLDPALLGTATERRGVLVKRPKPMQERRIDLPAIGVRTVEGAAKAGLAGIGFEAGGALLLEEASVRQRAEALGVFLYGFDKAWP